MSNETVPANSDLQEFTSLRKAIDSLPVKLRDMVDQAYSLAALVHDDQKRIGGEKYQKHLERVTLACANHAREKKMSDADRATLMAASILHDAVEDTAVTEEQVAEQFGKHIADIVHAVSHDKLPDGSVNENEPADVYLKRVAEGGPLAVLIKRYDRIDNMNSLIQADDEFRRQQIADTKVALALKMPEDAGNKSALSIWEKMDLEGTRMIHRAMTHAEAPDHLTGSQMIAELKEKLAGISFNTPKQFLSTPAGVESWKTMKIATVGLPQSGKSVMGGMFKDAFRAIPGSPSFLRIMCVPDGEIGDHQKIAVLDPQMADSMMRARRTDIKEAGAYFTPAAIDRYYQDVKNIGLAVTMIDLGGNPSPENKKILTFANGAMVIVSEKGLKSETLSEWVQLLNERNIPIVGFICSGFFDQQDTIGTVDENGVFFGAVHYAHRGQIDHQNRPTIGQFDRYLIDCQKQSADSGIDIAGYYRNTALENLRATSRTAAGVVDTTASIDKAGKMSGVSGAEAADKATANFTAVIDQLFADKQKKFKDAVELRGFVESIALRINDGITKEGVLIREGADSATLPYTKISDLPNAMQSFYTEFLAKLDDGTSPRELAAWVEYRIDRTDHFFADGCGKTAKAIAAWVLMRAKQPLPKYVSSADYNANSPKEVRGGPNEDEQWGAWKKYHASLFTA